MVYVFLADGFEEIEALTPIDVLRRGEVEVKTVGVKGKVITGSHGIPVTCDITDSEINLDDIDAVILPGGMPGTLNLEKSEAVNWAIDYAYNNSRIIGAICAAPSILGKKGFLSGKNATCYDGFEKYLTGARFLDLPAVRDGQIITARGAGAASDFAFMLLTALKDKQTAHKILRGMKYISG